MKQAPWIKVTVTTAALLAASPVFAGGYYGAYRYGHSTGYHGSGAYRYGHSPGYYGHSGAPYYAYGRRHGRHGSALAAGIVLGATAGYGRGYRGPYYYYPYPPARYRPYGPPPVVYVAPSAGAPRAGACLQEREYQTTVVIDGRPVEAYGTACLQPDGSWRRGPAKLVPEF